MKRVFIIEDDQQLAHLLKKEVTRYGYEAYIATDYHEIMNEFNQINPHIVLLDINLPSFDGFYWCRQIRTQSICPVIFISARVGEMDQVMALENGGDDFITKPFHSEVLLAKIRSQLRRAYGEYSLNLEERVIQLEGLKVYPERLELQFYDDIISLTKKEADILEVLISRHPRVAGREGLLEKLWDDQTFVDENTLNVNITRVRKKLQEIGLNDVVETVRGVGYRIHANW